jgi:hypothetical protein
MNEVYVLGIRYINHLSAIWCVGVLSMGNMLFEK